MNSGYSFGLVSNCKSILSLSAPPSLQYTLWTKLLFSFVWKLRRMPHAFTAQTFQCNESSGCGFWPRVCQSALTKQTTSAPSSRHPTLSKPHIIFLEDLQAKLISTRKQCDRRDALRILGKWTDTGRMTEEQQCSVWQRLADIHSEIEPGTEPVVRWLCVIDHWEAEKHSETPKEEEGALVIPQKKFGWLIDFFHCAAFLYKYTHAQRGTICCLSLSRLLNI